MKPLLLNSEDARGGAARAASRLQAGLRSIGVDASMLVQVKHRDDEFVHGPATNFRRLTNPLRPALDLLPILAYRNRTKSTFYPGWLPDSTPSRVRELAPDLVHLHWIAGGTANVRSLRAYGLPLVWTLHDMWAFTGGCHYDEDCGRFRSRCGSCPVLGSAWSVDLARLGFDRRHRAYRGLPLSVVAPSRWLAEQARTSALLSQFSISVIPNAIDTGIFRPISKDFARELLDLPRDRKLVLFGAAHGGAEPRKGFSHLCDAMRSLASRDAAHQYAAVVFGSSRPKNAPDLGVESLYVGKLNDDASLAALYSAADVYVAPSTQENLSNTVMESLACGTPCVAFDIGGMPDMIEHRHNGYLARPFDPEDLAEGIRWCIEDSARAQALAARARQKVVETFALALVAQRHLELYRQVLDARRNAG